MKQLTMIIGNQSTQLLYINIYDIYSKWTQCCLQFLRIAKKQNELETLLFLSVCFSIFAISKAAVS